MSGKKFVTLFNSWDVHLIKDVGLIPYGMSKYEDLDSYLATYDNGPYTHIDKDVCGLHLWFIPKITGNFTIDSMAFLKKNAANIDVLNLYHSTVLTNVLIHIYKRNNKNGKVYLKLDDYFLKQELPLWRKLYREYCVYKSDYVSTELYTESQRMTKSWGRLIDFIPDPYNPSEERKFVEFKDRSNIILTVGRLGTYQKNTELLLNAFASIADQVPDWNLALIGPIDKNNQRFNDFIREYFETYPGLDKKVKFYGEINDRNRLASIYEISKIFVLPSRYESFGIALMEAGLYGDFIVCTDIPSFREITDNYRFAYSFPSEDQHTLEDRLVQACHNKDIENDARYGYEYIKDKFNLKLVCDKIYEDCGI